MCVTAWVYCVSPLAMLTQPGWQCVHLHRCATFIFLTFCLQFQHCFVTFCNNEIIVFFKLWMSCHGTRFPHILPPCQQGGDSVCIFCALPNNTRAWILEIRPLLHTQAKLSCLDRTQTFVFLVAAELCNCAVLRKHIQDTLRRIFLSQRIA